MTRPTTTAKHLLVVGQVLGIQVITGHSVLNNIKLNLKTKFSNTQDIAYQ